VWQVGAEEVAVVMLLLGAVLLLCLIAGMLAVAETLAADELLWEAGVDEEEQMLMEEVTVFVTVTVVVYPRVSGAVVYTVIVTG
jgi:Ca2+/Na+ antiporter